jgi:hypothetical protein
MEHIRLELTAVTVRMPVCALCGKPSKIWSGRFELHYCGEDCLARTHTSHYEKRENGTSRAPDDEIV